MTTRMRPIFAAIAAALALHMGLDANARGNPISNQITFSTTGTVGTQGITGTPVVSFQGVSGGTLTTGSPFDLGQFAIANLPAGASTTYDHTPFELTFKVLSVNGVAVSPNETPITIPGWLYGSLDSGASIRLVAGAGDFIMPVDGLPFGTIVPPFVTGSYTNYLLQISGDATLPIQAELNQTYSIPEPSTVAFFASSIALAWMGWFRSARSVDRRARR